VNPEQHAAESPQVRFGQVFEHLQAVADYAARRGSPDPEALAAETMAIAWRRLDRVPADDPRPWLFVTARNLLMAERRREAHRTIADRALEALAERDREALVLIAWDGLTPAQAAATLGITPVAFRVRLLRARRRFERLLAAQTPARPCDVIEVKSA
jgi:RNA polymerase sigma-70 factor (ECF subfamily)